MELINSDDEDKHIGKNHKPLFTVTRFNQVLLRNSIKIQKLT